MSDTQQDELVPFQSAHLIERLDEGIQFRCKLLGESEEEHQRYAGIRQLLDELKGLLEEQRNA